MRTFILTLILALALTGNCFAVSVDRTYLMSANGNYVDLPQNIEDGTRVLIARARPIPSQEISVTRDVTAEEANIVTDFSSGYTNVNGLLVKVSMESDEK